MRRAKMQNCGFQFHMIIHEMALHGAFPSQFPLPFSSSLSLPFLASSAERKVKQFVLEYCIFDTVTLIFVADSSFLLWVIKGFALYKLLGCFILIGFFFLLGFLSICWIASIFFLYFSGILIAFSGLTKIVLK